MYLNPKKLLSAYLKKKKPLGIAADLVFVVLVILLLLPATRTPVTAFFIRMTSFPPSTLDNEEQFTVSPQAMAWPLYDLTGGKVTFETLSDKPVFLNIWATWCPPCIAELPGIQDLYKDYGDKVSFVLVSNEKAEKVRQFVEKYQYDKDLFYLSGIVPTDFSTSSIPTTYIISKHGKVVVTKKGAARWNSASTRELLDELLKQ